MKELQIEAWVLKTDIQKTQEVYNQLPYNNEQLEWLNYIEVCSFVEPDVIDFFQRIGVDVLKPSHLIANFVEQGTMVMYSGAYHLHGEVVQGEIDGWDVVIGAHCFSLTAEYEMVPDGMPEQVIEIAFEAVLPWMLAIPVPTT